MHSATSAVHWIGGGVIVFLVFFAAATNGAGEQVFSTPGDDSADARIDLQRENDQLAVRGLFGGDEGLADILTYELTVRRRGAAGTTRSTQSGTFVPTPEAVDTLSTVQVNVQAGDRLRLRLIVRAGERPVDTARVERTIS